MGILNVTPDSFYDGGRHFDETAALAQARRLEEEGAGIIDVGGESTRPGSGPVALEEELRRVVPVIEGIRRRSDIPVSIDTTKPEVARAALDAGADLINDVSGLRFRPELADLAAERDVPLVLMHSRHTPETMQRSVHYDDLRAEVLEELDASVHTARERGVERKRIIVDPGIGFAKDLEHNLEILATPGFLAPLGLPVLIGPSNKAFISRITGAPIDSRTGGTAAAVTAAVLSGAHFIRVHDVPTMSQAALVAHAMRTVQEKGVEAWSR
jgi:dihydropteroate synthase